MITINMEKAVEIKKDMLRRQRAELFKQLDVDFMKAMESGDTQTQQEITAKKQVLRDITDNVNLVNATSVEQLNEVTIESELNNL